MKKSILLILGIALVFVGCEDDLNFIPPDKLSPDVAFTSEEDLQLYANSFYAILPDGDNIVRGDGMSDYLVGRTISTFLTGTYTAFDAGGWSWGHLRNINYFLEHFQDAQIPEERIKHFEGLARFFRAWFYFDKVKRFGDVPWYDKTLDVDDPDLYKPRDSRDFVMGKVLKDLNFAIQHINGTKDNTATQITKWVALGLKSRVCLFEGTYRKYHSELGLEQSANMWLQESVSASEKIIDGKQYEVYNTDASQSYRNLFNDESVKASEVMLAVVGSKDLRVLHDANWYYTSATFGNRLNLTKTFINTYLTIDGNRFTDIANYEILPFWEEVKNRDLRLQQTIRMEDYMRDGEVAPPDFTYTYTGYQPKKLTLDSKATDGVAENNNSLPLMRYAEVLLNHAEAKAELGTFSSSDWETTIKPLRTRAGLSNTSLPIVADTYLQENYFPSISDPILLEIRRERGIELVLEGFRLDDLRRWKLGDLLEIPYDGMYVPSLNTLLDMNQDGNPDVSFVLSTPSNIVNGVYYYIIDDNQFKLSEGTTGKLILFENLTRTFEDYQYVYPIPFDELVLNDALEQNPGW